MLPLLRKSFCLPASSWSPPSPSFPISSELELTDLFRTEDLHAAYERITKSRLHSNKPQPWLATEQSLRFSTLPHPIWDMIWHILILIPGVTDGLMTCITTLLTAHYGACFWRTLFLLPFLLLHHMFWLSERSSCFENSWVEKMIKNWEWLRVLFRFFFFTNFQFLHSLILISLRAAVWFGRNWTKEGFEGSRFPFWESVDHRIFSNIKKETTKFWRFIKGRRLANPLKFSHVQM